MDLLDPAACLRIFRARDVRYDGRLYMGVTSTGIYCRPVCPARPPKAENCRFFPSAAAAQSAGFRPCLRCRPETAPSSGAARGTQSTVSRALALLSHGGFAETDAGVASLAERLGVSDRHLRRLFEQHLGASPVAVLQTERLHLALQLLRETHLPVSEVAYAAGYGSVRRFNESVRALFGRPPTELRRAARKQPNGLGPKLELLLRYRPPYDFDAVLAHLSARALEGMERVEDGCYHRVVQLDGAVGTVRVAHDPARSGLRVTLEFPQVRGVPSLLRAVRRLFDVDADIEAIGTQLSRDATLRKLVAARPGLRVPGAWDGFELGIRAVLGQQITVAAARGLGSKLLSLASPSLELELLPGLSRPFPTPAQLLAADLRSLGMPGARKATLHAMAQAALDDPKLFQPTASIEEALARLRTIRGVGEWTAQYIALRALGESDAFPAADVVLLKYSGAKDARALVERSEAWRPWRAYAAQHLWAGAAAASKLSKELRDGKQRRA